MSKRKKSPNNEALRQSLNVIEAKAVFDGPEIRLNLRVAKHEGALWYDLTNEAWQAVKITPDGWEVIDNPQSFSSALRIQRPRCYHRRAVAFDLLMKYINLKDEEDWLLLTALIAHAFVPGVPHAIPVFYGDKGSAKTTAQRIIHGWLTLP